jgi:hypothetical protein
MFDFYIISFFYDIKREYIFVVPEFFSTKEKDKVESKKFSANPFPFQWTLTIFPYGKSPEEKKNKV